MRMTGEGYEAFSKELRTDHILKEKIKNQEYEEAYDDLFYICKNCIEKAENESQNISEKDAKNGITKTNIKLGAMTFLSDFLNNVLNNRE